MAVYYTYDKYEDGKVKSAPMSDLDGAITGKCVLNLTAYFDENPEEAHQLGYIKHLKPTAKEAGVAYNDQTQIALRYTQKIDEYTVTDAYEVIDKTEEMLESEEYGITQYTNFVGGQGGIIIA